MEDPNVTTMPWWWVVLLFSCTIVAMLLAMIIPFVQWVNMRRHMQKKRDALFPKQSRRPWVRSTASGATKSSRLELRDWSCAGELTGCPWEFEGCDSIEDVLERIWCPLAADELHEALELLKLHVQTIRVARVEFGKQNHRCFGVVYGVAGGYNLFGGAPLEHDVSLEFSHEDVFDSFSKDQQGLNVPTTPPEGLRGLWPSRMFRTQPTPLSPRGSSSFMARAFGTAAPTPPRSPRSSSSRIASANIVTRHLSEPWKARLDALLPRRGVQAIHELPLQSLSPFYRIHDGFASLSSTLDLPDLLEAPDNTVAGSCFYIYPATALRRANRYPGWVRFARVDRNCVACASRREKRSKKIAYIERNGDRTLDDYSPLAFVGDTIYNMVAKTCCGKSVLELKAEGSSLSNSSIRALADRADVAAICKADIKGVRPKGEQEVGSRTTPKGEEGVSSSSSSPINSQTEEDLFEESVPCPLATPMPVFATGQPDASTSQMSASSRRHTGMQEWEPQYWTGSTTPTSTEKPEHA